MLSTEFNQSPGSNLSPVPQGTGFSYPLVPSFFVDAKMDENLGVPVEGAYVFVDEAQCLEGNKTLRAELRGGKAYIA